MAKKILLYIADDNLYYDLFNNWQSNISSFRTFNQYLNFCLNKSISGDKDITFVY